MRSIIVNVKGLGLGDFMSQNAAASLCKIKMPDFRVFVHAIPINQDQADSLLLAPHIDYYIYGKNSITLDLPNQCFWRPMGDLPPNLRGGWYGHPGQEGLANAPLGMFLGTSDFLGAVDDMRAHVVFRIPDDIAANAERELIQMGLDPNRWFACLHIRQPGYRNDGHFHPRSVTNLEPYVQLVRHIIHEQGGQVVRLGDVTMTPLPPMPGLIDLSRHPRSLLRQMFALSRARYIFGSDSGPAMLGLFFHVPTAVANAVNADMGRFLSSLHVVATKTFRADDGRWLCDREVLLNKLDISENYWRTKPDRIRENSAETLIRLADVIYGDTAASPPWPVREVAPLAQHGDYDWLSRMCCGPAEILPFPTRFLSDVTTRE